MTRFKDQKNRRRNPFKSKEGYVTSNDRFMMDTAGKPFGWDKNELDRKVRERCIARGITDFPSIQKRQFQVYSRLWKYRPNFRERQEIRRRLNPPRIIPSLDFTLEEMERLLEKLEGANEPLLMSIASKLQKVYEYEKEKKNND